MTSVNASTIRLCKPWRLVATSRRSKQSIFIINNSPFTPHVSPWPITNPTRLSFASRVYFMRPVLLQNQSRANLFLNKYLSDILPEHKKFNVTVSSMASTNTTLQNKYKINKYVNNKNRRKFFQYGASMWKKYPPAWHQNNSYSSEHSPVILSWFTNIQSRKNHQKCVFTRSATHWYTSLLMNIGRQIKCPKILDTYFFYRRTFMFRVWTLQGWGVESCAVE